jgi:hypothetical protein
MAMADDDGLVIDLVVGGVSPSEVESSKPVRPERVHAVARLFRLMAQTPAVDPPEDLVDSTLRRIESKSKRTK